jgi:hypothetical protein
MKSSSPLHFKTGSLNLNAVMLGMRGVGMGSDQRPSLLGKYDGPSAVLSYRA